MRLIAHRGFAARYPENTLLAVEAAAEVADLVEVDVRRCGSGELVVVHDETLDRVTGGTGRVDETDLAALRDLDVLGSGEPIPTLAEVLDAVEPPAGLVLDLKEPGVADDAASRAAAASVDVLVSAFDDEALETVAETSPGLPTALLFAHEPRERLRRAIDLGCRAVHPHHERCSTALVDRAHLAGLSVHAWTVADAATAEPLADAGVDGVIADSPDVLSAVAG